jgi:hypothetical protein
MKNNRRKLLNTIKYHSLSGNKINFIKCWKGTSYPHWRVLSDIAWKLINQGYDIMTEVEFKTTGRADLVAINGCGDGYIIEILHTESDSKFNEKLSKYPPIFDIVKVKTKDFDINLWEL